MGLWVSRASAATVSFATPQEVIINKDDDSITAYQGGIWNINDITGTISLPTGAATEATLSSVLSAVDGLEGFTDGIEGLLTQIRDYVDGVEGLLTNIDANTDQLEGFVDGLETLITSTNSLLTTIRDNADQLEGYLDNVETLITSTNTKLDSVNSNLVSIDAGIPTALGQTTMANSLPVVIASDQTPPDFVTVSEYLTNGGSKNMNVDGTSGSPITFSVAPTSGLTYFVESISFFISDFGTMDYTDFGAITGALTNGVLIRAKSKGTTYTVATLQDNIDIAMVFRADALAGGGATSVGFFNDTDFFVGELRFANPIILRNSDSDQIDAQVRDSLSGLDHLRCSIKYKRAS
jgi:hypothetical protein